MVDLINKDSQDQQGRGQEEGLRQILLRLTASHYQNLQEEIDALRVSLAQIESDLALSNENLIERDDSLQSLVGEAQIRLSHLEMSLSSFDSSLREEISNQTSLLKIDLATLEEQLSEPQVVARQISPVLVPVISERVRQDQDEFAHAVAPVIGPAIRHQIRAAKDDIIDSLYPLIGLIIGKAIAEAMRELTRNIDARLRQGLDIKSRLRGLFARLRGVSEAELLLRESLPFTIQHVFLIQRSSGILLAHLSNLDEELKDTDLISGMLTAIRDFVRDSFGEQESELEEISYGQERILIKGGSLAYLAVVLEGIEPSGYGALIEDVIRQVNLQFEGELRAFSGEMDRLPDFTPSLIPLLTPSQEKMPVTISERPMSRKQKLAVAGAIGGVLLFLTLIVFGCIFTIRLWPLVFPPLTPTPTRTAQPVILPTNTQLPPTTTSTTTPTAILPLTPSPTSTFTPSLTPSPTLIAGVLAGNLNVRSGPSIQYQVLGVVLAGEQVIVLEQEGDWYYIQRISDNLPSLEGWIWGRLLIIK